MFENIFSNDGFFSGVSNTLGKAFSAGEGYLGAPGSLTGGDAILVESLDATLKSVTYAAKNFKIWPLISKERVGQPVGEYDRMNSYGDVANNWFPMNTTSSTGIYGEDPVLNRIPYVVKAVGTLRTISTSLMLSDTITNPVALQITAGVEKILGDLERNIFTASSYFVSPTTGALTGASADTVVSAFNQAFFGLDQQIRSAALDVKAQYGGYSPVEGYTNVIDLQVNGLAQVPDEDTLTEMGYRAGLGWGNPTDAFFDLKAVADISRQMLPKEWITPPGQSGRGGFVMTQFVSGSGTFNMIGSNFLNPPAFYVPLVSASASAPATPVVSGTTTEADASSKLQSGTYYYRVSALNNNFESLAAAQNTQAVTAGNRVAITIAAGTTGAVAYKVYRSATTGSGWKFIGFVKDSTGNGGGAVFRDAGALIPGCSHGYLLESSPAVMAWKQQSSLLRQKQPAFGPNFAWIQYMYGTPVTYAPLKGVIVDNIGKLGNV